MNNYDEWLKAKSDEAIAIKKRREIEDKLLVSFSIDVTSESSKTYKDDGYAVKISQRVNTKIDSDKLQDIARHEGLDETLSQLFKWKPTIDKRAWDSTDKKITSLLSDAITVTPGRASFTITKED